MVKAYIEGKNSYFHMKQWHSEGRLSREGFLTDFQSLDEAAKAASQGLPLGNKDYWGYNGFTDDYFVESWRLEEKGKIAIVTHGTRFASPNVSSRIPQRIIKIICYEEESIFETARKLNLPLPRSEQKEETRFPLAPIYRFDFLDPPQSRPKLSEEELIKVITQILNA